MEAWLVQITNHLLAQSWQIAALAIIVGIATIILKNKSAHVRYLLWLIVLAKCLTPAMYSIPLAVLPQEHGPALQLVPLQEAFVVAPSKPEPPVTTTPTASHSAPTHVLPSSARATERLATYSI